MTMKREAREEKNVVGIHRLPLSPTRHRFVSRDNFIVPRCLNHANILLIVDFFVEATRSYCKKVTIVAKTRAYYKDTMRTQEREVIMEQCKWMEVSAIEQKRRVHSFAVFL